jgi:hypothetical protein
MTRRGRTKSGQATPVRRSARGFTADVEPASMHTTGHGPTKDGLALTSRESGSTHTLKRGRTEDDQHNGKGGKKARRASLSYLLYAFRNEAMCLYQVRPMSPIPADSPGSDQEDVTFEKATQPKAGKKVIDLLIGNIN